MLEAAERTPAERGIDNILRAHLPLLLPPVGPIDGGSEGPRARAPEKASGRLSKSRIPVRPIGMDGRHAPRRKTRQENENGH